MEDTLVGLGSGAGVVLAIMVGFFRVWAGSWPTPRNGSNMESRVGRIEDSGKRTEARLAAGDVRFNTINETMSEIRVTLGRIDEREKIRQETEHRQQ